MRVWLLVLFALPLLAKEIVAVSILPQKYFIDQISGGTVDVEVMVPKGASPATYSPKPSQLKTLKEAKVYFTIKVPFEKAWMERFFSINPKMRVVDMGKYLKRYPMAKHNHEAHKDYDHDHGLDPHIWLAPPYAMGMARVALEELCELLPQKRDEFIERYQKLIDKIAQVDGQLMKILAPLKKRAFFVYHPSFGYFARVYRLHQIAIEKEGKEPTMKELANLMKLAKKEGVSTIFIEPQFPKKSALFLAKKIGARVVVVDPLAYEWDRNILEIGKALVKSR